MPKRIRLMEETLRDGLTAMLLDRRLLFERTDDRRLQETAAALQSSLGCPESLAAALAAALMVLRETLPPRLETAELIHLKAALDGVDALIRVGTAGRPARTAPPAAGVAQRTLFKVAAG